MLSTYTHLNIYSSTHWNQTFSSDEKTLRIPRRKQFEQTNMQKDQNADGDKHQSTFRIDTEEEDEVRIEYENLTQARSNQDKTEEPIKVVKEVIKHTEEQTHQETENTLEKGEKQDPRTINTGDTNKDTQISGKQKETSESQYKKKTEESEDKEKKKHITTEKDDDKNVTETVLEPEEVKHTLETEYMQH